jgi:hypothetical protein
MGEWVKGRAPGDRWHLNEAGPAGAPIVACGTQSVIDQDAVSWTDPDHHPPDAERCPNCQAAFSGAMPRRSGLPFAAMP